MMDSRYRGTVWVINQFAGTPVSGWGERHFYLSRYWTEMGYKVNIITGSYNHMFTNTKKVEGLYNIESYDGISFCWVKTPKYNPRSIWRFYSMLIFMFRVLQLPVKILGRPDTIIVSSMPIFPIYSGWILKRRYLAKLIFEIRDIWPLTLQYIGNKSSFHPAVIFIGWFEKLGYRVSDAVVSLLPNAKQHIEMVAGREVKFHYIPNGIDENLLSDDTVSKEILLRLPKNKFIVGYTGTLGRANALEYLIEAAKKLTENDNIYFVIVGDGYLKKELMNSCIGKRNILFLPKIPKNQVQSMISLFDICFVGRNDSPLFQHGVSANKYFDYMLAGKPILDSNNLIKDPVELSGAGIIVKPDSSSAIMEGVLKFYNMTEIERNQMGRKGSDYVRTNHKIKNLAVKYSKLFID